MDAPAGGHADVRYFREAVTRGAFARQREAWAEQDRMPCLELRGCREFDDAVARVDRVDVDGAGGAAGMGREHSMSSQQSGGWSTFASDRTLLGGGGGAARATRGESLGAALGGGAPMMQPLLEQSERTDATKTPR